MSYCRVGKGCDIYCYEDADSGYMVHIASHRIAGDVPQIDWTNSSTIYESEKAKAEFMSTAMRVPIGGLYDGKPAKFDNLIDLYYGLIGLVGAGYLVPQKVIDVVKEEMEALSECE